MDVRFGFEPVLAVYTFMAKAVTIKPKMVAPVNDK
jgi:hypothetical protein